MRGRFREEALTTTGAIKALFERLDVTLEQAGYIDASLIAAPPIAS